MTTHGFFKRLPRLGAVALGAMLFTAACADDSVGSPGPGGLTPDDMGSDTIVRRYPPGSPMCRLSSRELLDQVQGPSPVCGKCTVVFCGDTIVAEECTPDCGQDPPVQNP